MDTGKLRRKAELQLKASAKKKTQDVRALSAEAAGRLIHELQTHQIELELQNEALRLSQEELAIAHDSLMKLYDFAPVGYITLNLKNIIVKSNVYFADMLGMPRGGIINSRLESLVHSDSQNALYFGLKAVTSQLEHQTTEVCFVGSDNIGTDNKVLLWGRIDSEPVIDEAGNLERINLCITNISDQHNAQLLLEHQAFYDTLTDLPNRQLFLDRFEQYLLKLKRSSLFGALLYIDIDNFKLANDTLGHSGGDEILRHVGMVLDQQTRASDTAARFGGDEFLVLLTDLSGDPTIAEHEAESVANKICAQLTDSMEIDNRKFRVDISVGIALFSKSNENVDDIIRHADIAMYQNKTKLKTLNKADGSVTIYNGKKHNDINNRLNAYRSLRSALNNNEFFIHYQPQVDSHNNVYGAECLLRWRRAHNDVVPPSEFISILEDGPLIIDVGEWVLRNTCQRLVEWQSISKGLSDLTLSVNISAMQLNQKNFPDRIEAILEETGANPKRLVLEITENMSIKSIERTIVTMQKLKHLGLSFSIDDFGTGYSSLTYIKRLPIDILKIDRSFVHDIDKDEDNQLFVNLFLRMAKNFGLKVIFEGMETEAEYRMLLSCGSGHYQGYYFSKPLSSSDFVNYVTSSFDNNVSLSH